MQGLNTAISILIDEAVKAERRRPRGSGPWQSGGQRRGDAAVPVCWMNGWNGWRSRPSGRFPLLALDARQENRRRDGTVRPCAVRIAAGVREEGKRCIRRTGCSISAAAKSSTPRSPTRRTPARAGRGISIAPQPPAWPMGCNPLSRKASRSACFRNAADDQCAPPIGSNAPTKKSNAEPARRACSPMRHRGCDRRVRCRWKSAKNGNRKNLLEPEGVGPR